MIKANLILLLAVSTISIGTTSCDSNSTEETYEKTIDRNTSEVEAEESKKDHYFIVEEMPQFPGGQEALKNFIAENVKYPSNAEKNNIEGKVYISFVIDTDGTIVESKVVKGVENDLDQEALRVINSLPKWKPGYQKGIAVKVAYTIPISFKLR